MRYLRSAILVMVVLATVVSLCVACGTDTGSSSLDYDLPYNLTNTPDTIERFPSYSPDGTRIVFLSKTDPEGADCSICVMDADGTDRKEVFHISYPDWYPEGSCGPTWSRDGKSILFGLWDGSVQVFDLATGNIATIMTETESEGAYYGSVESLCYSPDGTKILFAAYYHETPPPSNAYSRLYVMESDGSNITMLPCPNDGSASSGSWSPDGSAIAFSYLPRDPGPLNIYVMNADGTNPMRLTTDNVNYNAIWSPDGSRIAFTSHPMGAWYVSNAKTRVYVMDRDGANMIHLTDFPLYPASVAWSPGGNKLILEGAVGETFTAWGSTYVGLGRDRDIYVLDVP